MAARLHREGRADDAYPFFEQLESDGRLYPDAEDYEALFAIQEYAFTESLLDEPPRLVERARQSGQEERTILGGTVAVSATVQREDEMELIYVVLSQRFEGGDWEPPQDWIPLLLAAFYPWVGADRLLSDVSSMDRLPHRAQDGHELIFAALRELPS